MREAARVVGPFGEQDGTFTVIAETEFVGFAGSFETIEIGVHQRRIELLVSLEDGEVWGWHFPRMTERGDDRAGERGLAHPEPA